jgi:hypothetical protein
VLKRLLAREIRALLRPLRTAPSMPEPETDNYRSVNALAESTIGLYKTGLVKNLGP